MMEKLISKKDFNEGDLKDVLNECMVFLTDINKTYGSLLGKFEITDKKVCEDLIHHNILNIKDVELIVKKELNSTYLNKMSKGFEFKAELKAKKMIWKELNYIKFSIVSYIYYNEEKIHLNTIHFLIGDISAIDEKFVGDLNALNLDDKAREFLIEEHSVCDIVGCDVSSILNNLLYDIENTVKKNMTIFSPDNLEVDIKACIKENYEVLYKYVKTNIKSNRLDIILFNEKTSILFEEVRYLKVI